MLISALLAATIAFPAQQNDNLAKMFQNPPDSAKPHTWWHWMDGNVTKQGITADIEAMKSAGLGGAQMFSVAVGIPAGPVGYMSPKWREMITHAVKEADRVGLELCIHNCAGWSSSGGPWIKPEQAMQVLAWSKAQVHGPAHFSATLPQIKAPQVYANVNYRKDIAVFAFRTPMEGDMAKPDSNFLGRTGVVRQDGLQPDLTPGPAGLAIPAKDIVVLTDKMDRQGKLEWDAPEGDWTILRVGHTPTGKDNHPSPPEGDGLEVDKLSKVALDAHWAGMMAKVIKDVGPLAGKVLNNSLIDSYEVGSQNWTPKFREEFQKLRGYDMLKFLPVIAGFTVESKEISERFLWDFRRTIADLYAVNYYGYFGTLCHKAGMKFSTEPYGNGGFDNIQAGGKADIPMGEFWVNGGAIETTKVASSVGHTYGRKFVGAESFTADENAGRFLIEPSGIKALGDQIFCNGINRYIFHRYAHQPWMDLKPGMTMGPWGTHFERTVTWWNQSNTWLKYVARCQSMLQSGRFVADALYFYGEGAPADLPYRPSLKPRLPEGYDYDGCDATIVQSASVKNGKILLPSGMTYSVLVLPDSKFMTPGMVRKIKELVAAGATVVGPKPTNSASLMGYPGADSKVQAIADEVWGSVDGTAVKEKTFGKGKVVWGKTLNQVFDSLHQGQDFSFKRTGLTKMAYIHRQVGDADVYFVSNQRYNPISVFCNFRVGGKVPELWRPETGKIEGAPVYRSIANGTTTLPLQLGPAESVFVVFRKPVSSKHSQSFTMLNQGGSEVKLPKISIKLARYETNDGRGTDVTQIVSEMVSDGSMEIPATNDAFGDPVVNVVKHLRVQYEIDGKPYERTVSENETLKLVDMGSISSEAAPYELRSDLKGNLSLTAWKPGTFKLDDKSIVVKEAAMGLKLNGSWKVTFPPNWGAPASVSLGSLISWSDHSNPGVKYFSGTATYSKEFEVPASMLGKNRTVVLDLGRVKNFAKVSLNGRSFDVQWKAPFTLDASTALRKGTNKLEVQVTNLWPNRLIGDEQLPPDVEWNGMQLKKWPDWMLNGQPRPKTGRFTFVTWHWYNKDSKLLESGLIGPVTIRSAKTINLKK